ELFNAGAWLWMKAMVSMSRWFAEVPGGVWAVAQPHPVWWIAYYGILLGPHWGALATRNRRRIWIAAGVGLCAAAFGWTLWARSWTGVAILPGDVFVGDAPGRKGDLI